MPALQCVFIPVLTWMCIQDQMPLPTRLDAKAIQGDWKSVGLTGRDIGDFVLGVEASFQPNGQWTMTAKLRERDSVVTSSRYGSYRIEGGKLVLIADEEELRTTGWLEDGRLVLQDPDLDSRVHFRRVDARQR